MMAMIPLVATSAGAASAPGAPAITSVIPRGLGLLVSWVPANLSEGVVSYTLSATAASAAGVSIPPGCAAPTPATVPATDSATIVGGLCAGVPYRLAMVATNSAGSGPASDASNPVVPLAATVPAAPLITSVVGRDTQLIVGWAPPSDNGGQGLTQYTLTATPATGGAGGCPDGC
jgi:hypothetical protein